MSDNGDDYEVGYGKPPKHTRWKPGQSGNPGGKEKGHKGLKTDLEAELNTTATVAGKDGWSRKGRQQRLAIATLVRRASQGDLKAQGILFPMILNVLGVEDRRKGPRSLSQQDQVLLDEIIAAEVDDDENALEQDAGGDMRRLPPPADMSLSDDEEEGGDA